MLSAHSISALMNSELVMWSSLGCMRLIAHVPIVINFVTLASIVDQCVGACVLPCVKNWADCGRVTRGRFARGWAVVERGSLALKPKSLDENDCYLQLANSMQSRIGVGIATIVHTAHSLMTPACSGAKADTKLTVCILA